MRHLLPASLLASLFFCASAIAADTAPHIGRYTSTPADTKAINKVIDDFQAAIVTKDTKLLSSLVLHSNILFVSPPAPDTIMAIREKSDTTFDGIRSGGYNDFARFIKNEKASVEEKFYNVKITQDNNVAWVMFDYEFLVGGKVQNYGLETWQMIKVPAGWKIASVMWTMNFPPK